MQDPISLSPCVGSLHISRETILLQEAKVLSLCQLGQDCSLACIMPPVLNLPKAGGHNTHPIMAVFFSPSV